MAWGDFADFANERENIDAILVCSGTLYMNYVELAISIFRLVIIFMHMILIFTKYEVFYTIFCEIICEIFM